jgi:hypothetical protein
MNIKCAVATIDSKSASARSRGCLVLAGMIICAGFFEKLIAKTGIDEVEAREGFPPPLLTRNSLDGIRHLTSMSFLALPAINGAYPVLSAGSAILPMIFMTLISVEIAWI